MGPELAVSSPGESAAPRRPTPDPTEQTWRQSESCDALREVPRGGVMPQLGSLRPGEGSGTTEGALGRLGAFHTALTKANVGAAFSKGGSCWRVTKRMPRE